MSVKPILSAVFMRQLISTLRDQRERKWGEAETGSTYPHTPLSLSVAIGVITGVPNS